MIAGSKPDTSYLGNGFSETKPKLTSHPHNRPYPSCPLGGFTNPITNFVFQGFQPVIIFDFGSEPLKKGAIDAMLGHPLEMALHRSWVAGREELCWLTVWESE